MCIRWLINGSSLHVSVQSQRPQGAQYPCWLKLHFVKIVNYGKSVYDYISGVVTAYIGSGLVDVFI